MCGIAGIFSNEEISNFNDVLLRMGGVLRHRGPDDSGVWIDNNHNLGLAHQRLSIQDMSADGHQPMISASERFVIVFNGEVYNFLELKKKYFGTQSFRGN